MKLKDAIRQEACTVFLSEDDFAEIISIEDVPEAPALCDWSVTPEGEHLYGDPDARGVNAVHANITLGEDVIPTPEVGQEITVNGEDWIVVGVVTQSGLLGLKLFRNVA